MNLFKKLATATALYGVSSIIGRFLNYLLFPLHTQVLEPGSYGIVTELYSFVAFLNIIYIYGLETSFFRYATKNPDKPKIYNTATTSILLTGVLLSVIISFFATDIVNWMNYEGKEHFVYIFCSILTIDAFLAIPFAKLRMEGKAKLFASAKIISILVNISINVFFLYFCEGINQGRFFSELVGFVDSIYNPALKVEYIFIANLTANAIIIIVLLKTVSQINLKIDKVYLKKLLRYGFPIMITSLALVTNEMLSRITLKYWLPENFYEGFTSQDILGIFGGVFKLAIIMNLGIQAFRYAAEPFFFEQAQDKDSPKLFANLMNWFVIFGCVVMIGVSINLEWLQYLLRDPDYRIAIHIVPMLLLANLFMGINYNLSVWYKTIDFTKAGAFITIIGAIITIIANYILIPLYGYEGSAYASVIAYVFMSVFSYFWSRYKNPIPYPVLKVIGYIILSYILIIFLNKLQFDDKTVTLLINNFILLIFVVILLFIEKRIFKSF